MSSKRTFPQNRMVESFKAYRIEHSSGWDNRSKCCKVNIDDNNAAWGSSYLPARCHSSVPARLHCKLVEMRSPMFTTTSNWKPSDRSSLCLLDSKGSSVNHLTGETIFSKTSIYDDSAESMKILPLCSRKKPSEFNIETSGIAVLHLLSDQHQSSNYSNHDNKSHVLKSNKCFNNDIDVKNRNNPDDNYFRFSEQSDSTAELFNKFEVSKQSCFSSKCCPEFQKEKENLSTPDSVTFKLKLKRERLSADSDDFQPAKFSFGESHLNSSGSGMSEVLIPPSAHSSGRKRKSIDVCAGVSINELRCSHQSQKSNTATRANITSDRSSREVLKSFLHPYTTDPDEEFARIHRGTPTT